MLQLLDDILNNLIGVVDTVLVYFRKCLLVTDLIALAVDVDAVCIFIFSFVTCNASTLFGIYGGLGGICVRDGVECVGGCSIIGLCIGSTGTLLYGWAFTVHVEGCFWR